jgi:hypothetical protein
MHFPNLSAKHFPKFDYRMCHLAPHLKVYAPVAVLVEYSKDLLYENNRVAGGEDHAIHVQDLVLSQSSVGTVLLKGEDKGGKERMKERNKERKEGEEIGAEIKEKKFFDGVS